MKIELDVFSGRPNPNWVVTESTASDLLKALGSLHTGLESARGTGSTPSDLPGLGYRGFVVRHGNDEWLIFDGHVWWRRGGRAIILGVSSEIENALKALARSKGYGELLPG